MTATAPTIEQRLRKLDGQRAKWEQSQIREDMLEEAALLVEQAKLEEARGCGSYADHLRRHADKLTREATA